MTVTSISAASTTSTVSQQIEALAHGWDNYFCPPYEVKLWPELARMDRISKYLLHAGKTILINILPAAITLQLFVYFNAVDWTNLALDAWLALEVGPCRPLTRLLDRVAPYPQEDVSEVLTETTQVVASGKLDFGRQGTWQSA